MNATESDVIRRLVATEGKCAATLQLQNTKTLEFYDWTSCDRDPGHAGAHSCDDNDGNVWARFEPGLIVSRHLDRYALDSHIVPSPWTDDELRLLQAALDATVQP